VLDSSRVPVIRKVRRQSSEQTHSLGQLSQKQHAAARARSPSRRGRIDPPPSEGVPRERPVRGGHAPPPRRRRETEGRRSPGDVPAVCVAAGHVAPATPPVAPANSAARTRTLIRRMGAKVGVALSPGTPLEVLEYVIEDTDVVLLMTVDPGYKGQMLVPQMLRKIEKLSQIIKRMNQNIDISVDGCVNADTIPEMVAAGANILVLGSSGLFRKDSLLEDSFTKIYEAIDKGCKSNAVEMKAAS